ncbi:MAG: outer membrane lipoprotein carrier protein LolA [Tannerellaceae bacterium]|jgi:outer membrane lipoprotein-sorting protein|nr:outer membrane lipoprotein carrier protein LolA [Tannerellaceae bacterium]
MKRLFPLAAGLWLCMIPWAEAQDAAGILSGTTAALDRLQSLTASFSLHTQSAASSVGERSEGVIHLQGEKFTLSVPGMKIWYDGLTQWVYSEQTGEVSVSNPQGEDLLTANPVLLFTSSPGEYIAAYRGEATALGGQAVYVIELRPGKPSNTLRIELQIEKQTSLPLRIRMESKNKLTHTIHLGRIQTDRKRPADFFTFSPADYPEAEVIDLR